MRELAPGTTLSRYEVLSHIRSGGMASLYLGRLAGAAGFSRLVALKVIHPHLAQDPHFVGMFVDEARLSSRIRHPNVVSVEELIEAENTYVLAMDYVHGCTLGQLLSRLGSERRRLQPELATAIVVRIADALHAAHELTDDSGELLDVVHRDISPQNVLLSFSGHVKLIDFGIAQARDRIAVTVGDELRGKLGYMAPEQATRKPIDRRTDVYALAVVLWELLTSRRFNGTGSSLERLDYARSPTPKAPHLVARRVPRSLSEAVMRALAVDRADRPPTADAFRRELVDAMPSSVSLHATDFARLLGVLMKEEREVADAHLPSAVLGEALDLPSPIIVATDHEMSGDIVATMTAPITTPEGDSSSVEETKPERPRSRSRLVASSLLVAALAALAAGGWFALGATSDTDGGVSGAAVAPGLDPTPVAAPTPVDGARGVTPHSDALPTDGVSPAPVPTEPSLEGEPTTGAPATATPTTAAQTTAAQTTAAPTQGTAAPRRRRRPRRSPSVRTTEPEATDPLLAGEEEF